MTGSVNGVAAPAAGVRMGKARGQDRWSGEPAEGAPKRETGGVRGPRLGPRIQ